jgi:hypothetical protein
MQVRVQVRTQAEQVRPAERDWEQQTLIVSRFQWAYHHDQVRRKIVYGPESLEYLNCCTIIVNSVASVTTRQHRKAYLLESVNGADGEGVCGTESWTGGAMGMRGVASDDIDGAGVAWNAGRSKKLPPMGRGVGSGVGSAGVPVSAGVAESAGVAVPGPAGVVALESGGIADSVGSMGSGPGWGGSASAGFSTGGMGGVDSLVAAVSSPWG